MTFMESKIISLVKCMEMHPGRPVIQTVGSNLF